MEIFTLVISCFAIGLIARNIEPRTIQLSHWINKIIINLILPVIVLSTAPDIRFNSSSLFVITAPWIFGCLLFIPLCIWLSRKLHLNRQEEAVVILLSILGNTAFIGIAMTRSFLGEASIPPAILYDQLGNFTILATLGTIVIAIYKNQTDLEKNGACPSATTIIRKVVCFPPFCRTADKLFYPFHCKLRGLAYFIQMGRQQHSSISFDRHRLTD